LGGRFGFGAPLIFTFGGTSEIYFVPQAIIGFYVVGGDDGWFGLFVEARPGFKIGFGGNYGFSIPIMIGLGTSFNLFD
jgi:hypothetical protein